MNVGTNDISLNKRNNKVPENFVKLAKAIKINSWNVPIWSIVPQEDCKLKVEISEEMWRNMKKYPEKKDILLIKNNNTNSKRRLSKSKPHLNDAGPAFLVRTFKQFLTTWMTNH